MEDDPVRRPREITLPRPMAGLSMAELEAYVAMLRAEIARAETEMDRQRQIRGAAEALFKKPPA